MIARGGSLDRAPSPSSPAKYSSPGYCTNWDWIANVDFPAGGGVEPCTLSQTQLPGLNSPQPPVLNGFELTLANFARSAASFTAFSIAIFLYLASSTFCFSASSASTESCACASSCASFSSSDCTWTTSAVDFGAGTAFGSATSTFGSSLRPKLNKDAKDMGAN